MPVHFVDAYPEKECRVDVAQISKAVWKASGRFQGEMLYGEGRTEQGAVNDWKPSAEWRYRSS